MCVECHGIKEHRPGCPIAPPPKKIYTCALCKEDICAGDYYVETDDKGACCIGCIEDMPRDDLLKVLGVEIAIAEEVEK